MIFELKCEYIENIAQKFDILLTDNLRKTSKLLIAINIGAEILDIKWLIESYNSNKMLDFSEYRFSENGKELFGENMGEIQEKIRKEKKKIFENYEFYLSKGVVPAQSELRIIIETGGGKIANNPIKDGINIFNEKKEKASCEQYKSIGYLVCGSDLIIEAVLTRKFNPPINL